MTVRDLIDRLSTLNPDAEVTISANGGEYVWELDYNEIVEYTDPKHGVTVQLGDVAEPSETLWY